MTSTGGTSNIVFRGTDGNECEEFIAAIEELAFTEGWSRDRERMLLFARSRLRHKALRWFAQLDPSIKNDWDLFVKALFDRYPLTESPPEVEIATPVWSATTFSPSASTAILPPDQSLDSQPNVIPGEGQATVGQSRRIPLPDARAYDPSILGRQLGILRIAVEDGGTTPQYVRRGRLPTWTPTRFHSDIGYPYDQLGTTIDRQEALVVCFISSPEPHSIGCLNSVFDFKDLSLRYIPSQVYSYELRAANGVVPINQDGSLTINNYDNVSKVWNILSDGSLQASLCGYSSSYEHFKSTEIHLDVSGGLVCFVKPGTPLWQDDPSRNTQRGRYEFKARIVFEPL